MDGNAVMITLASAKMIRILYLVGNTGV